MEGDDVENQRCRDDSVHVDQNTVRCLCTIRGRYDIEGVPLSGMELDTVLIGIRVTDQDKHEDRTISKAT